MMDTPRTEFGSGTDDLVVRAQQHIAADEAHIAALRAIARKADRLMLDRDKKLADLGVELANITGPALATLGPEVRS
ncbi:hypothetical protein AB0M22_09355 [Nocardia sp. NPDC051756]|uniref:hypothetical protein n=1 Tax=Nocardia sp. NPDC051756 TaxID=3154751 RepID=UPI00343F32E3